jgi:hypothetical protein
MQLDELRMRQVKLGECPLSLVTANDRVCRLLFASQPDG